MVIYILHSAHYSTQARFTSQVFSSNKLGLTHTGGLKCETIILDWYWGVYKHNFYSRGRGKFYVHIFRATALVSKVNPFISSSTSG